MKTFAAQFRAWLGERTEPEAARLLGIARSTVGAYARGTRRPGRLAIQILRERMAAHPERTK